MRDKDLIEYLGGSTKLAELLGLDPKNGVQRVNNWKTRGIPAAVKLDYPDIFLSHLPREKRRTPDRRVAKGERRTGPRRKADVPD